MSLIDDILYNTLDLQKNWPGGVQPVAIVGGQMPPAAMQYDAAGWEVFRCMDVDESVSEAQEIKPTDGILGGVMAINEDPDTLIYLKFYLNAHGDVDVGSDTPWMSPPVPYNSGAAGFIIPPAWPGIPFTRGLTIAATTGRADGNTDAPDANVLSVHAWYL
jgi:hypothetical protein